MKPPARLLRLSAVVAAATLSVAACAETTAPPLGISDLSLLEVSALAPREGDGYLSLLAGLPPDVPLDADRRLALDVTTSRGDRESMLFRPPVPMTNSEAYRFSREYLLVLEDDADAEQVLLETQALGLRHRPGLFGATSYIFARDESAAVAALRATPGVRSVEPNSIGCIGICWMEPPRLLHGVLPLDRGPNLSAGDNSLNVAAGDTIRIQYRLTNGAYTTSSWIVQ